MEEIKKIGEEIKSGSNPMQFKKLMAYEIVKSIKSEKEALLAKENWEKTFSKKEIPTEMEEVRANIGESLVDVLLVNRILTSKSEWRRLVEGKGVHDLEKDENITDVNLKVSNNLILKIGKKRFLKILIK